MTDLTEQWKKGELITGWYYIKAIDRFTFPFGIAFIRGKEITMPLPHLLNDEIEQVLAPVPSYEEWQSMDRLEKIMLQERARLNKQVTELLEENTKLKELLKECRDKAGGALQAIQKDCESDDFSIFQYPEVQYFYDLLTKINQTLGGDK